MSDLKASLYLKILEFTGIDSGLQWFEFEGGYCSGYINLTDDEASITVAFSIPKKEGHCYVMVSDGDAKEACKEVASLQQYNDGEASLCFAHTVPTENTYMNNKGWVKYLLANPIICFKEFPNESKLSGVGLRFLLALPLNETDVKVKSERGFNGLMDYLTEQSRDPFSVQTHNKHSQQDAANDAAPLL